MKFTKPSPFLTAFHCAHFKAYAAQNWYRTLINPSDGPCYLEEPKIPIQLPNGYEDLHDEWQHGRNLREPFALVNDLFVVTKKGTHHFYFVDVSQCSHCNRYSIWIKAQMVYPDTGAGAPPHDDLPEHLRADYMEAASIIDRSPRGAAALLRLIFEQLLNHVGDEKKIQMIISGI